MPFGSDAWGKEGMEGRGGKGRDGGNGELTIFTLWVEAFDYHKRVTDRVLRHRTLP